MILGLAVAAGAGLGAVLRYLVDLAIQERHDSRFPFGTFTINTSGALVLGLLTGLALHHGLHHNLLAVVGTGVCGGFTTFSTWAYESVALLADGAVWEAGANVVLGAAAGILAAAAGFALALW